MKTVLDLHQAAHSVAIKNLDAKSDFEKITNITAAFTSTRLGEKHWPRFERMALNLSAQFAAMNNEELEPAAKPAAAKPAAK